MLTPEKSPGLTAKLGQREKIILLLMLKQDEPAGRSQLLWNELYRATGIEYGLNPKKSHPTEICEEKKFRYSIFRLVKRGFIKPKIMMRTDFSLPDPRGYGYSFYRLTPTGRLAAEKIQQQNHQQEQLLRDQADLEAALGQLQVLGYGWVINRQIREILWTLSADRFDSQVEVDSYWNNTKLGLMLKKHTTKKVRAGVHSRHLRYGLGKP